MKTEVLKTFGAALVCALLILLCLAATTITPGTGGGGSAGLATNVVGALAVNPNQFGTNFGKLNIKSGALLTNPTVSDAVLKGVNARTKIQAADGTTLAEFGYNNYGTYFPQAGTSAIAYLNADSALIALTIGAGLTLAGDTLSASASAQTPWAQTINGANFGATNVNHLALTAGGLFHLGPPGLSSYIQDGSSGFIHFRNSAGNDFWGVEFGQADSTDPALYATNGPTGGTNGTFIFGVGGTGVHHSQFARSIFPGRLQLGTNSYTSGTIISNNAAAGTTSLRTSNSEASTVYLTTAGVGIGLSAPTFTMEAAGTMAASNLVRYSRSIYVETNSTANSNLTLRASMPELNVSLGNHISLTNYVLYGAGTRWSFELRITPSNANYNVVWPTFNSPALGVLLKTNLQSSAFFTSFTSGFTYVYSGEFDDTNGLVSLNVY